MDAQPVGKSGFPAGGRPGHEYRFRLALKNSLGDIPDGLVVQRFVDADELGQFAAHRQVVQIGGVHDVQNVAPAVGLGKAIQEFGPRYERRWPCGVFGGWHLQHDACSV